MTSPFAGTSRSWDFLPGLTAVRRSNFLKYNTCCCSSRSWIAYIFLSFNILLQLILCNNLSRVIPLSKLCWTPLSIRESGILVINFCQVAPLCMNKTMLKCAKNHGNRFGHWRYKQKMWAFKHTVAYFLAHPVYCIDLFLADHTIGRAFGTLCRLSVCLSSVVCDVLYCGETVFLAKKCLKDWIGNQSQKVHFLGRRHISTSGFAATATETTVFALFLPIQPNNQY